MLQGEDAEAYKQKEREIKQIFKDKDLYISMPKYSSAISVSSHTETLKHTHALHATGGQAALTPKSKRDV